MVSLFSLQSDLSKKTNEKTAKEEEKQALDDQIELLREAERKVAAVKATIGDLRGAVRDHEDPSDEWKGQQRDNYHDYTSGDFRRYYNSYYDKTDDALDAIVLKIADLEIQSSDLGGLIGDLASAITKLLALIKTLIN